MQTGFEFPPVSNTTLEPMVQVSPSEVPINDQVVAPTLASDTNKTVEASTKPDDGALTIGLTVGLICGSAIGVGIFLLVFLLKKDQRKNSKKSDLDESGTNYTPLDPIFAKTRFIPYEALTIMKEIGSGSFGKVCLGYERLLVLYYINALLGNGTGLQ